MHRIDPMNRERATADLVDFCHTKLRFGHKKISDIGISRLITLYGVEIHIVNQIVTTPTGYNTTLTQQLFDTKFDFAHHHPSTTETQWKQKNSC